MKLEGASFCYNSKNVSVELHTPKKDFTGMTVLAISPGELAKL